MDGILTTATPISKGHQLAVDAVAAELIVIDAKGYKVRFSAFIKTVENYNTWIIYWNENGQNKYGRASSLFCFNNYNESPGWLMGVLAESGRSGSCAGDFDEVGLAYIERIRVGTPDRCFSFAKNLHRENKDLKNRLAKIEKRIRDFLE